MKAGLRQRWVEALYENNPGRNEYGPRVQRLKRGLFYTGAAKTGNVNQLNYWLGYLDSNQEMVESESTALPFGYTPSARRSYSKSGLRRQALLARAARAPASMALTLAGISL